MPFLSDFRKFYLYLFKEESPPIIGALNIYKHLCVKDGINTRFHGKNVFLMYNTLNSANFHAFFFQVILITDALFIYNKLLTMIFCRQMNEIQAHKEDIPEITGNPCLYSQVRRSSFIFYKAFVPYTICFLKICLKNALALFFGFCKKI